MSIPNPRLVLWMFWIQLVVIKPSVQLVPQTSYLKIESQTSSLCPASKERRMCSQQATYLQASRTRSQQESTPGLEEEKKMLGVRGTSLHSAGRGRGARYLCTWAISQPGISQPGTDTSTRGVESCRVWRSPKASEKSSARLISSMSHLKTAVRGSLKFRIPNPPTWATLLKKQSLMTIGVGKYSSVLFVDKTSATLGPFQSTTKENTMTRLSN